MIRQLKKPAKPTQRLRNTICEVQCKRSLFPLILLAFVGKLNYRASPHIPPEGILMHETQHKKRKDVVNRLSRIEGHVRGLRKMVEEDKDCPDILLQVAAVRAALNQVGRILLEDHMETCVLEAAKEGTGEKAIEDLKAALVKFL